MWRTPRRTLETAGDRPRQEADVHIPDGFINAPTSAIGGVIAAGLVVLSVRKAAVDLDDRQVPLAGLTAAFIFAVQMLNFPVAGGTSGHLIGGCLAAILVGPWVGGLVMSVVFLVQALVFADGGLSALGLNIIVMGYVPAFIGYGLFRLFRKVLPANRLAVTVSAGLAAFAGVLAAALLFVGYYAVGGAGDAAVGTVAIAMLGVHALIGIGEGVITAATVGAVLATRPDLVYGARDLRPPLANESSSPAGSLA
jgi:cobalt/nickel transport system permease protein